MNTVFTKLAQWMSNAEHGFTAAYEQEHFVFGARRPGFPFSRVSSVLLQRWIAFMQAQGITRVLCLLAPRQLAAYDDLLGTYRQLFGQQNVLWVPIDDFHIAEEVQLIGQIVPFLAAAEQQQEKTVVHCSGGVGRTGHVLAAWLVSYRGMSNEEAITAVKRQGRNARESRDKRLDGLLDRCREVFSSEEYILLLCSKEAASLRCACRTLLGITMRRMLVREARSASLLERIIRVLQYGSNKEKLSVNGWYQRTLFPVQMALFSPLSGSFMPSHDHQPLLLFEPYCRVLSVTGGTAEEQTKHTVCLISNFCGSSEGVRKCVK
jgi:protein-tyrosine phosphatase